jgi:SAM-dependent methyltransferase
MTVDDATKVFFEIHDDIPRGGPGGFESTRRAFLMLTDLPKEPTILDVGCGPGMQTLDLAVLTKGNIVAIDNHPPFLNRLRTAVKARGLTERVVVQNADMAALDFHPGTFDVIWAEGSAYIMGFENALGAWKPLLKNPGYVGATEITWLKPGPPETLRSFWWEQYPAMQDVNGNLRVIDRAGYRCVGHFTLPTSDWWDPYYTPIQEKLTDLKKKYLGDNQALSVVNMEQNEIDFYRLYADYYGYVFYVMQTR